MNDDSSERNRPGLTGLPRFAENMMAVPFSIGQIAMSSAKLERVLVWIASRLLGTEIQKAERVVLALGATAQKNLISSLSEISDYSAEIKAEISLLGRETATLLEYRNSVVHGQWSMGEDGVMVVHNVSASGAKAPKSSSASKEVSEMMARAMALETLIGKYAGLLDRMDGERPWRGAAR